MKLMKLWTEYYLRYDNTIPKPFLLSSSSSDDYRRWMANNQPKEGKEGREGRAGKEEGDQQSDIEYKQRLATTLHENDQLRDQIKKMKEIINSQRSSTPSLELKYERSLYHRLNAELLQLSSKLTRSSPSN